MLAGFLDTPLYSFIYSRGYYSMKTKTSMFIFSLLLSSAITKIDTKRPKEIKVIKLLTPIFWSARPKKGNYCCDTYHENTLSNGTDILAGPFYYRNILAPVESICLNLGVLSYKSFILKHLIYLGKSRKSPKKWVI